jgi:hypothetical protein
VSKKVDSVAARPPRGGQHPVAVIALSVPLVLDAGCSLRGCAAVMATLAARQLFDFAVPAVSTIRSWILRLGYAELTRPLDRTQR